MIEGRWWLGCYWHGALLGLEIGKPMVLVAAQCTTTKCNAKHGCKNMTMEPRYTPTSDLCALQRAQLCVCVWEPAPATPDKSSP